jgi:hypothetical protein
LKRVEEWGRGGTIEEVRNVDVKAGGGILVCQDLDVLAISLYFVRMLQAIDIRKYRESPRSFCPYCHSPVR